MRRIRKLTIYSFIFEKIKILKMFHEHYTFISYKIDFDSSHDEEQIFDIRQIHISNCIERGNVYNKIINKLSVICSYACRKKN